MTDSSGAPSTSQYRGDLARTPLPEILATIHRYRAPGVIECTRATESKNIYLENGNVIFATSNNLDDSLGIRLLRQGLISREAFDESVSRLRNDAAGRRQGTILVEMRAITPRDLYVGVRDQVQEIVWSIFEWNEGQVIFTPGLKERHGETIKLSIPTRQAILRGVRRIRDVRRLVGRIGGRNTILQPSAAFDLDGLDLTPDERRLLQMINGRRSLVQLTESPPLAPAENARIVYALYALGAIEVKLPIRIQVDTSSMAHWRSES